MTNAPMLKNKNQKKRRLLKDKLSDLPISIDRFNFLIKGKKYHFLMRLMDLITAYNGLFVATNELYKTYATAFNDPELHQFFTPQQFAEWMEEFSWIFRIEHLTYTYVSLVERHRKLKPDATAASPEVLPIKVPELLGRNTTILLQDLERLYNRTYCTKLSLSDQQLQHILKPLGRVQLNQFTLLDPLFKVHPRCVEVPPQFVCQEWTYGLCSQPPSECRLIHGSMVSKQYQPPLCHFYLKGNCHYGDECFFSHSENEAPVEEYLSPNWVKSPIHATPMFTTTGISSSMHQTSFPPHYSKTSSSLPTHQVPPLHTAIRSSPPESPWSPLPNSPFATSPHHSYFMSQMAMVVNEIHDKEGSEIMFDLDK